MQTTQNALTLSGESEPPRATILVVDDDRLARQLLKLLLEPEGYNLVFAESGTEALQLARPLRPDLVLLDVELPDLQGDEVCRQIRSDPVLEKVPVIMVTALSHRDARIRGIEAGADDFISKPFDHLELLARVRTITRLNRYRRMQEGQRLAQQIEMAAAIQELLLPRQLPDLAELEIVSRYRPAAHVGGDYYDLIMRHERLYFVVADVSGHGLAAALFMASGRSALRALLPSTPDVLRLAEAVNQRIVADAGDSGMFLSAVIGCYDPGDHSVTVVNCGHPEPIVRRANGAHETIAASSAPLGLLEQLDAAVCRVMLAPGDLMAVSTDGAIEAASPSGEQFGYARLQQLLPPGAALPLGNVADLLLDGLHRFTGRSTLADDLTILLLRRRVPNA
jgi:sigma-B regulation protein RsbU (phosphoserine phosphatase)